MLEFLYSAMGMDAAAQVAPTALLLLLYDYDYGYDFDDDYDFCLNMWCSAGPLRGRMPLSLSLSRFLSPNLCRKMRICDMMQAAFEAECRAIAGPGRAGSAGPRSRKGRR